MAYDLDDDGDTIINAPDSEVIVNPTEDPALVEPAPTYPVSEEERIGVMTDEGTDPVTTDQGDEQNDAVIWGTPDAPGADHEFPPKDDAEHGVPIV